MRYNIEQFLHAVQNGEAVDFSLYKNPEFCKQLRLHVLTRIKILIFKTIRRSLSNKKTSQVINQVDRFGFSIMDYCIIAGLDEPAVMVLALGGQVSDRLDPFWSALTQQLDYNNLPESLSSMIALLESIDSQEASSESEPETTFRQKIGQALAKLKEFGADLLENHKWSVFLFILALACFAAIPFTVGASSVIGYAILSSLAIPSFFAAFNDFYKAYKEKQADLAQKESLTVEAEMRMLSDLMDNVMQFEEQIRGIHERSRPHILPGFAKSKKLRATMREDEADQYDEFLHHLKGLTRRDPMMQHQKVKAWLHARG